MDVDVAVIDTGVDFQHPDLNVAGGVNCYNWWPLTASCKAGGDDDHYHGTHVAGTIGALDNGIGVVGWGVGGIEAEAGMLGQPVYFLTPDVVGVNLKGKLKEGVTATDLVLTVTELLRKQKVVGKFVEFFGEGTESLAVPDRATIANMAPEYGATMGFFPIDEECVNYLRATGRSDAELDAFETYYKAQGMFGMPRAAIERGLRAERGTIYQPAGRECLFLFRPLVPRPAVFAGERWVPAEIATRLAALRTVFSSSSTSPPSVRSIPGMIHRSECRLTLLLFCHLYRSSDPTGTTATTSVASSTKTQFA